MKRDDYINILLELLRVFEVTLTEEHNHNYLQMVRTLEMYIDCETVDGGDSTIHTLSVLYLDRIQRLFLPHNWTRQHELCREWRFAILAVATQES